MLCKKNSIHRNGNLKHKNFATTRNLVKYRMYSTHVESYNKIKKVKWYNTLFLTTEQISDEKSFIGQFITLDPHAGFSILCRICYSNILYKMVSS